jgi:IS30 family transposase
VVHSTPTKGTDLSVHDQAHLDAVARELNGRPQQTLGWVKPSEALARIVAMTD